MVVGADMNKPAVALGLSRRADHRRANGARRVSLSRARLDGVTAGNRTAPYKELMGGFAPSLNRWPGNQGTCSRLPTQCRATEKYGSNGGRDDSREQAGTNTPQRGIKRDSSPRVRSFMAYDSRSPRERFAHQRRGALRRDVPWELTFEQWWRIWSDSGLYRLRGTGRGLFVMARNGPDIGPYAVGNVRIASWESNLAEGPQKLGSGRGWTYRAGYKKPFQVVVKHRYVGCFETEAEAVYAYRDATA